MIIMTTLKVEKMMKNNDFSFGENNVEKSYGVALSEKQLKFLIHCIDVAQESLIIKPDKEEMDLIRRIRRKHDELQDDKYDSMMN